MQRKRPGVGIMKGKKPTPSPDSIGTTELASICNISERRVQKLVELGVFEKVARGQHRRHGCAAAYKDYCVKSELDRRPDGNTARDLFESARARKLKLENDVRDRQLIELSEALAEIDHIYGEVRTSLAGIPALIAEDVANRRRIEDEIDKVLTEIANRLEESVEDLRTGGNDSAADDEDDA